MTFKLERELFDACAGLPPDERETVLSDRCPDAKMRERIARLLQAHDSAEAKQALETPPMRLPEQQIGRYRLLERIGEGAMGEVYLAEQTGPASRRVALKVVKPGMDSREVIARFQVERQTLALMSHPSIAHIIEAGTTEAGRPYFAMEYVPGIALTKYCDRHRLTIDQRLALFLQICDAVQHAHQKGVIHRDLKPSNLLVTEVDGKPTPKIIDFGIAKAMSSMHEPSLVHTRIGHLIGTPEYMSPEQAQLSPLDIDTRSDIYSLGVVLYELVTGLLPFKTADATATPAELVQELLTNNPSAPSTRVSEHSGQQQEAAAARQLTLRQLAARLSGDLDWIVLKALEKDRNRRYASPSEFAADVRRHLANEPVLAGPPSALYRMRKFAARHRVGLSVTGILVAAALTFGVLMVRQSQEIALQRDEAKFQAQRAEASSEFMSLLLEEVGPGGRPLTPEELLEKGVELLDRQYGADPHFTARMLLQMSRRFMDIGSTKKHAAVLARAETIARDAGDDDLLAAVECAIVGSELEATRYDQAKAHLQIATMALSRLSEPPVTTQVDCLRAQADVAEVDRDSEAAERHLNHARELLEQSNNTRGLKYNSVITDLGGIYFRTGRFKDALLLNASSAEALDRNGRGGTLARATVAVNRASLLYRLGEVRHAQEAGLEAMRRLQSLREDQPISPSLAISYSITLNRLDRTGEALNLLEGAREQTRAQGNEYWGALASYHLGRGLLLGGKFEQAQERFDEARKIWSANESANIDRIADLTRSQAELELARGRNSDALALIEKSLAQFGFPAEKTTPGYPTALTTAARIYLQTGQREQAEKLAAMALRINESIARNPAQSADVGEALFALAAVQNSGGNGAGARTSIQRAVEALGNALGKEHRLTAAALELQRSIGT
jgi:serine/threonine protein kinase/tetratricopeptide (TPR) repeat protein